MRRIPTLNIEPIVYDINIKINVWIYETTLLPLNKKLRIRANSDKSISCHILRLFLALVET